MVFLTKNSRVAHLWSRTTLVKRQKKLYRKSTFSIKSWITSQLFNEKVNLFKPVMIKGGGINASIICIETLFLAEYCGFGWVVGIFFWVFWFCFVIARKTNFKVCRVVRRAAVAAAEAGGGAKHETNRRESILYFGKWSRGW